MNEWPIMTLGDLIHVKHGFAFKGEFFASAGEKLVLKPGNFPVGGGICLRPGKDAYYTGPYPPDFELSPGDLLVVMTDLTQAAPILGSPAFVPDEPVMLHNQRLGLVQIKEGVEIDRGFLYYAMLSDASRSQIRATATGATVRHTAPERIYRVRLGIPPLRLQQVVGDILRSIDDLIENNRRRVAVLEEMARAIYREWFVKFCYPGHEDVPLLDSTLGPIPEGWEISTLAASAEVTMGQSPKSEFYNVDGIGKPFHQGVTDFGPHFPSTRKWCSIDGRSAEVGDILISVRAPVGRINIADVDITIGRGLSAIRAKDGRQALLLGHLREAFSEEDSMGNDGAIFKSLGKAEMASVPVVVPPGDVADAANTVLAENLNMIRTLTHATQRLSSLRD
ncbi:restriction endonuclease subunit S [Microlunatus sp. Y2014]|uniref:restriction endonuclease subunit S n=1 Tax=Microlunatus sp. Y2014 TaxID=3418488 RepID=UPI003DA6E697